MFSDASINYIIDSPTCEIIDRKETLCNTRVRRNPYNLQSEHVRSVFQAFQRVRLLSCESLFFHLPAALLNVASRY